MSTYRALKTFRDAYPTGTVVLVSDNGLNYSNMAKQFNCIYFHETTNTHLAFEPDHHERIARFFTRLRKYISCIKEDYFMLLEDDNVVLRRYTEPFLGTLCGNFQNTLPREKMLNFRGFENLQSDFAYTGYGGSIVQTKPFLDIIKNEELVQHVLDTWEKSGLGSVMGFDSLSSVLVICGGGTLAKLHGQKDLYTDNVQNFDSVCVLHQCKDLHMKDVDESIIY